MTTVNTVCARTADVQGVQMVPSPVLPARPGMSLLPFLSYAVLSFPLNKVLVLTF